MKKNLLSLVAIFAISFSYSQELYFFTGTNITKYDFRRTNGSLNVDLESGIGTTYEIGYKMPLKNSKFSYAFALSLNDYNAVSGSATYSYKWNTKYIGVQNTFYLPIYKKNNFQFIAQTAIGFSSILYGKQESNGVIYDLKYQDEFSGLIVVPSIGFQTQYKLKDYGFLCLGYNLSKSISPFNTTSEKLSFTTNQIIFGINFNIDKK